MWGGDSHKPPFLLFSSVTSNSNLTANVQTAAPTFKLKVLKATYLGLTPASCLYQTRPSGVGAGCRLGGMRALRVSRGVHDPYLQHFEARSAGQAGRRRGPGEGFSGGLLAPPRAPLCPRKARGLVLNCNFARAPMLFQALGSTATASAPPGPTRSSWREKQKRKPVERPPASPTAPQHTPVPRDQLSPLPAPRPLLSPLTPLLLTAHPSEPRKQQETPGSPEFRSSPVF